MIKAANKTKWERHSKSVQQNRNLANFCIRAGSNNLIGSHNLPEYDFNDFNILTRLSVLGGTE